MPDEPAYTRLPVDERRAQILEAANRLFAEHAFEELSMRELAEAAGISKPLLYHYFPSKTELFKAAVSEHAAVLQSLIEPTGEGTPLEQLSASLDAYLAWIADHSRTWEKLIQSAATLPEAREFVEGFRTRTMEEILARLTGKRRPAPALRIALSGWLAYVDAAILEWIHGSRLSRAQLRDLLVTVFGAGLYAAQQADPRISLTLE